MAIEFKCSTCGKPLFAQEQFAGLRTTCPACQSKMPIPFPTAPIAPDSQAATPESAEQTIPDAPSAPQVFPPSMPPLPPSSPLPPEAILPPSMPALPVATESAVNDLDKTLARDDIDAAIAKDSHLIDVEKLSPNGTVQDPVKRCPICAETIKAAAKKCRFCGEIFSSELRVSNAPVNPNIKKLAAVQLAKRSDKLFRAASILATMLTNGWLIMLTLNCMSLTANPVRLNFLAPWTLFLFNMLLIGGLFSLIRQMRNGPYHVFLAAAFAIVVCTPLDIALGLDMPGMDDFIKQARSKVEWSTQALYVIVAIYYGMIGTLVSVPVWCTALKLAIQAYVAEHAKEKK